MPTTSVDNSPAVIHRVCSEHPDPGTALVGGQAAEARATSPTRRFQSRTTNIADPETTRTRQGSACSGVWSEEPQDPAWRKTRQRTGPSVPANTTPVCGQRSQRGRAWRTGPRSALGSRRATRSGLLACWVCAGRTELFLFVIHLKSQQGFVSILPIGRFFVRSRKTY